MRPVTPALVSGYAKSFSVKDCVYRGRPAFPGRTLCLVPKAGAVAPGVVFEVPTPKARKRLFQREAGVSYTPSLVDAFDPVSGESMKAIAFIADPLAADFIIECDAKRAEVIRKAVGQAGPNLEYFVDVVNAEQALGLGVSREIHSLSHALQSKT